MAINVVVADRGPGGITGTTGQALPARPRVGIRRPWAGLKLYGKLDDAAFRKVILLLLPLASGIVLIAPRLPF